MSDLSNQPAPIPTAPAPATPAPTAPAAGGAARDGAYRPLCLLAVAGFGVAALYALVVVLGGLVAYFRGEAWVMHAGWAVLPIAGAVLSALGLARVRRSEGTLAGGKLARWGLLLSALVGLSYGGYVGATYFAIGREAEQFGDGFMGDLAADRVNEAFRLTLQPGERPAEGPDMRGQLENRFNAVGNMDPKGQLTRFSQAEAVRLLGRGGPDTKVESLGVNDWKPVVGGYQVRLMYRITSPLIAFDMHLLVQGKEGRRSEGRKWFVVWEGSGMVAEGAGMTEAGKRAAMLTMMARAGVQMNFLAALAADRSEQAYLQTRLPDERDALRRDGARAAAGLVLADGIGLGALPAPSPAAALAAAALVADGDLLRAAALPGYDEFLRGGLVRADKDAFWAPEEAREKMVEEVRQLFRHPDHRLGQVVQPDDKVSIPRARVEGDRYLVEIDAPLRFPATHHAIDARLVVDCDAKELTGDDPVKEWRVRRLELISGRSVSEQQPRMPDGGPPPGS